MIPLTPGRLTAVWLVLRSLEKLGGIANREELLTFASKSSLRSGGLPVGDGYKLALRGRFAKEVGADTAVTEFGRSALRLGTEDEPTPELRRVFLSALILADPPPWVAYWQGDPAAVDHLLTKADVAMLSDAGLWPAGSGDQTDFRNSAWWDALSVVPLPESAMALRKAIGDAGEQLTLEYERNRLVSEGFPSLADKVWWAAQESPAYGFDVGSFRGAAWGGDSSGPLAIEVKSVAYPVQSVFPLHFTVHEWRTAQRMRGAHTLHLWDRVRVGAAAPASGRSPIIVSAEKLADHIAPRPTCSGRCTWESMQIDLPLSAPV